MICVGRLKENYWKSACDEYAKRMKTFCSFSVVEVDEEKIAEHPSDAQITRTLEKEGERILSRIPKGAKVIAMCIEGKQRSSERLAAAIENYALDGYSNIVFVIGGSWGLSDEVKAASSERMSMSLMTFPHQLARVMLCEQIYRAFQINNNGKYHK